MRAIRRRVMCGPAAVAALASMLGAGCGSPSAPPLSDADRSTLRQYDEAFAKAANAKDFASASSNYATDASLMPPNEQVVKSRDAILKWFQAFPPISDLRVEVVDVDGRGDFAYTRGNYSMAITPPGSSPVADHGKFLEIWQKQADGTWKIKYDMFSSDMPPGPAPASR